MALSDSSFNSMLGDAYDQIGIRQSKPGNDYIRQLLGDVGLTGRQELQFGDSLEPMRQQALLQYLYAMSNPQALGDQYRYQAMGQAGDQGMMNANMIAQHGGGIGSQQGAFLAARNQANSAANNFLAQLASPQGQQQRLDAMGQGFNSAYGPAIGMATNFANTAEGYRQSSEARAASHQTGGILGGLGGLLGTAASGLPWGSILQRSGNAGGGFTGNDFVAANPTVGGFGNWYPGSSISSGTSQFG